MDTNPVVQASVMEPAAAAPAKAAEPIILAIAADEGVITVPETIQVAKIQELSPATPAAAVNLKQVMVELQKFQTLFYAKKPEILAQEKAGYISVIDNPKDSLADVKSAKKRIAKTRKYIVALDKNVTAKIKRLDALVLKVDQYCQSAVSGATEKLCIATDDKIGRYEGQVSVITAMFKVMEDRYEEANLVFVQ